MSENVHVKDLFEIPDEVLKSDFVVKLTEGVEAAEKTAGEYVATPSLVDAFDRSLRLVGGAFRDGRSRATYLHGSFGSGKSHFMALLSLMLDGHEAAWRIPELHPLRPKHEWVGQKKVLQLRFHVVGQPSLESVILGEYVRWVSREHPEAPAPALFVDEALFENAAQLAETLGDEHFFAPLNQEGGAGDELDWGAHKPAGTWDRERFEAASR